MEDIKTVINLRKDVEQFLYDMKIAEPLDKYYKYIMQKKNLIFSNDDNIFIKKSKEALLLEQIQKENTIDDELLLFDGFNIPFIGMKGPFIKTEYYGDMPRIYKDLDLLVEAKNASAFYKLLIKHGYRIKKKTYYDLPGLFMRIMPETYINNTQTLMLINKEKNISIDLHSNINITNAHFKNNYADFSTTKLFNNSTSFLGFSNIKQFETHDNICFCIRHLLKHHIFYGRTQTGFKTTLQHLMDLAVLFNSHDFSYDIFIQKVKEYNIVFEALFCVDLYNKVFKSARYINEEELKEYLKNNPEHCFWLPVLNATLKMQAPDIMIGNYKEYFPKTYKAVEYCQNMKSYKVSWVLQALIINTVFIKIISHKYK